MSCRKLALHEAFKTQRHCRCIQTVFDLFPVPVERKKEKKDKNREGSTALEVWLWIKATFELLTMQARPLGTWFSCLRQQKQRLSVWRRVRGKALGRTHWATLHLTEYAVFSGYLTCVHEITTASRAFQYQRKSSGSGKLLHTAQSQRRVSTTLPALAQPEMTLNGNSPTEGSLRRLRAADECYHCQWHPGAPQCQGTPGTRRTADNDTGRYGSKERGRFLERAQNKDLNFLGDTCLSAVVQETCRFPDLQTKTPCNHLLVASGTSGSRTPKQWKVCEALLVTRMVSMPLIFQTPTTELDCKTGRNKSINTTMGFFICKTQAVMKPQKSSCCKSCYQGRKNR